MVAFDVRLEDHGGNARGKKIRELRSATRHDLRRTRAFMQWRQLLGNGVQSEMSDHGKMWSKVVPAGTVCDGKEAQVWQSLHGRGGVWQSFTRRDPGSEVRGIGFLCRSHGEVVLSRSGGVIWKEKTSRTTARSSAEVRRETTWRAGAKFHGVLAR